MAAFTQYWVTSAFYLHWISPNQVIHEGEEAYIGCGPFKSRKYATKEHKRYAWVDPHPEKNSDGRHKAKFDAEAHVRKQAKVRAAELERERALQAECRSLADKAVRCAEVKKLELLVNDGVGETWRAE